MSYFWQSINTHNSPLNFKADRNLENEVKDKQLTSEHETFVNMKYHLK